MNYEVASEYNFCWRHKKVMESNICLEKEECPQGSLCSALSPSKPSSTHNAKNQKPIY